MIRNEALVEALKRIGLVPASTTNVSIHTTGKPDDYVRIAYEHTDEHGDREYTTTRVRGSSAVHLNKLDWTSLVSD